MHLTFSSNALRIIPPSEITCFHRCNLQYVEDLDWSLRSE
jgi:hypothetical protein